MREIDYSNQFERDYKRESKSAKNTDLDSKLEVIIDLLSSDFSLPRKERDHALKGEFIGTRECHVKPDLLLIYFKSGKTLLTLVRLGSHSELFS
jgi:mRNA interferase YafQ